MENSKLLSEGSSRGSRNTWSAPPSITSPSSPTRHDGSQQSRRLQLRNAGFRAPVLPSRNISPILGPSQPSTFNRSNGNNENSPLGLDRRTLYAEDMSPSPVNILQEIQNSTRRKRQVTRPGLSNIFQDQTTTESTNETGETPWSQGRSSDCSSALYNTSPVNIMKLREGSLNQKTPPPLSSPLAKHVKGRNLNRLNLRSTSFEASKYIEHLESQLTTLNAKLDSLVSPNTNKARAAKLRALTVEARSLRHEVADWEKNFTERVREGVDERLGVESGLKARLEALEDEGEIKDMRIKELEFEVETLRLKAKDTEALEITNINLERRIDVLTSLLVQSPTKLDSGSATSSPGQTDPQKRTPRPRSLLPRVPSSPGGVRLSLNAVSESSFWRGRGLRSNSSISETPEDTGSYVDEYVQTSPESRQRDDAQPLDSPYLDTVSSPSNRSVPSSSSRPTSLQSSSSQSATSWGLPLATDTDLSAKSATRQRRMRRFPSGACSLKPLILPNAAGTQSLPASAPPYATSDGARRETSNHSLDPTTAFLSHHDLTSPIATPTQQGHRASTIWAREQALRALEGQSGNPAKQLEDMLLQASPVNIEEDFAAVLRAKIKQNSQKKPRPKSLEEELKKALLDAQETHSSVSFEDGLIPIGDAEMVATPHISEGSEATDSILTAINNQSPTSCLMESQLRQRHTVPEDDITPKPPKRPPLMDSTFKSLPSTTLAKRSAFGLFSSLTEIISHAKQEPTLLARRLLYNAWSLGSKRLGGIGWWLLGLVLRPGVRPGISKADAEIGEENGMAQESNRTPFRTELNSRRAVGCFMRTEGRSGHQEPHRTELETEPHVFLCDHCVEPSSRRTLRLWFQFSLTIVLAVGIAIKHGPGVLLIDPVPRPPPPLEDSSQSADTGQHRTSLSDKQGRLHIHKKAGRAPLSQEQRGERPILFAKILQPRDFEDSKSPPPTKHHWPS